jgi:hypothetical protein
LGEVPNHLIFCIFFFLSFGDLPKGRIAPRYLSSMPKHILSNKGEKKKKKKGSLSQNYITNMCTIYIYIILYYIILFFGPSQFYGLKMKT